MCTGIAFSALPRDILLDLLVQMKDLHQHIFFALEGRYLRRVSARFVCFVNSGIRAD